MPEWLDNITNKDFLQDNLTFVSLYIAIYENLADYVECSIRDFLCDIGIEDGEMFCRQSAAYKKYIVNRKVDEFGNKNILKSSFLWLIDQNAISMDDYQCFLDSKKVRNRYAHELSNVMFYGVSESEVNQFFAMYSLYQKISKWFFLNIDYPIMADDIVLDPNVDLNGTYTVQEGMFSVILQVLYAGKSQEFKDIIKKVR